MRTIFYSLIIVIGMIIGGAIFIKSANHFIKAIDPLAQQMAVLDNAKSPEIVKIKGELMRDLVHSYYAHSDTILKLK